MSNKVFGFYIQQGGNDYPANFGPDDALGYVVGSDTPIFEYSINDVERALVQPRVVSRVGNFYQSRLSELYLETYLHDFVKTIDPSRPDWTQAFQILEFVTNNQVSVAGVADVPFDGTNGYKNKGDEIFSTGTGFGGATRPTMYVPRSFVFEASNKAGRLSVIEFSMQFASGIYEFRIYLDPNFFVDRSENLHYAVYRYEEITDDGKIDETEFNQQIVGKLFNITKTGRYNRYDIFDTIRMIPDVNTGGVPTGTYHGVTERFFVFTTFKNTVSDTMLRTLVKDYLRSLYTMETLKIMYPSLFDEDSVTLIPMFDNTTVTLGGAQTLSVHPVSLKRIRDKLVEHTLEYNPSDTDYLPTEIFHVGNGEDGNPGTNSRYPFPIIAIEKSIDSGITEQPITKRFPEYRPLSGVTYTPTSKKDEQFHHYVILSLGLISSEILLTGIPVEVRNLVGFTKTVEQADTMGHVRDVVTFTFNNTLWTVYGEKRNS